MKNEKKFSSIIYFAVFVVVIAFIGIRSYKNLANFYINDEVDYNEWSADLGSKLETDIATTFFEKMSFVNINGAVRNIFGQQEMNGVIKLNNGYLFTTMPYIEDTVLQNYVNSISVLNNYMQNRGTKLVYALTPYTSGKYDSQLPEGVEDYGNDNADRLMSMLDEADIDIIDFREKMHDDGIDHYDMMYKTDHHWNTKAGFYAYEVLEDYVVNNTGCNVDKRISDLENYTVTIYKDWHLGSNGQRTGKYFAGVDDFELYIPNFETKIKNDAGAIGKMQDLVINTEPLVSKDYNSRYTYDHVLGKSLEHYINLDCKNDLKILLVTDSFGKAVAPYLIMGFSEISYVYDGNVSAITPDYIEAYDPDVVILLYYTQNAMEAGAYTFQGFSS